MSKYSLALALFLPAVCCIQPCRAGERFSVDLTFHNRTYSPSMISAPRDRDIYLRVTNLDPEPINFEIEKLGASKQVHANSEKIIKLGPLSPGTYIFIGELRGIDEDKSPSGELKIE